jgi:hypothetical protein
MPDRVIKMVNDWGWCHAKENIKHSLTFLNCKKQLYDWDNDDLQDEEDLIEDPKSHPELPAKFPSINLESKQPHHHHLVEALEASNDEHINTAICNAFLDDLPCNTSGVRMAFDKIEIHDWIKQQQTWEDPYNDLLALPTMAIPPKVMPAIIHDNDPIRKPSVATNTEDKDLGSIIIGGVHCSASAPAPQLHMKVGFDNKSYLDSKYRDGTIHIMVGTGHDAKKTPRSIPTTSCMHSAQP